NPTHVIIQSPIGSYLSDELKTEVVCRSYGARPYSLITWLLDGVNVTGLSKNHFDVFSISLFSSDIIIIFHLFIFDDMILSKQKQQK
ncbi:hypothetical protein BLA29_010017, partial [Euroglyphus maynei]